MYDYGGRFVRIYNLFDYTCSYLGETETFDTHNYKALVMAQI